MQIIAEKVGYNETTFVLSSEVGDIRMRYFTPVLKWIYVVMGQ